MCWLIKIKEEKIKQQDLLGTFKASHRQDRTVVFLFQLNNKLSVNVVIINVS